MIPKVSKSEIFHYINSFLDIDEWSDKELKNGREVDVDPEWPLADIIWEYRWKARWAVLHYVHDTRHYFLFSNPNYRQFNDGKD